MNESRYGNSTSKLRRPGKIRSAGGLPHDFVEMVRDVFTTNFDRELKKLAKIKPDPRFKAHGEIFPNEIVLSLTLSHEGQLAATTVHASVDFDPKASSPTAQDLLAACVDALGEVYSQLLVDDPAKLAQLADESLSALENIPFDWTALAVEKHKIFVKVDKSNPDLDQMADDWLAKNDPHAQELEELVEKETEKLFVTGPKAPGTLEADEEETDDDGEDDSGDEGGRTVH